MNGFNIKTPRSALPLAIFPVLTVLILPSSGFSQNSYSDSFKVPRIPHQTSLQQSILSPVVNSEESARDCRSLLTDSAADSVLSQADRVKKYLTTLESIVHNPYAEQSSATNALVMQHTKEFLFDFEAYVAGSLRMATVEKDRAQNQELFNTANDYAEIVKHLNDAVIAINQQKGSPTESAQQTNKLIPNWLSRISAKITDRGTASRMAKAEELNKKADEIIENARDQHEALLTRIKRNDEAINETNRWLARFQSESDFLDEIARELAQFKNQLTSEREVDAVNRVLAKIQNIKLDLHDQEAQLRRLQTSRISLIEGNLQASNSFSNILTLKRFDFQRVFESTEPKSALVDTTTNDKKRFFPLGNGLERHIPQGVRIASLRDLKRRLVIGENVLIASERTYNGEHEVIWFRGSRFSVVKDEKSYFLTLNPFNPLIPLLFSPIAQISRGKLPEPLLSYVRLRKIEWDKKKKEDVYTDYNITRQAVAITDPDLIYAGFRVGDILNGSGSIESIFEVRGFTFWGNILLHQVWTQNKENFASWQVYSPRQLRKLIATGQIRLSTPNDNPKLN